jgi:meiotically up-regulated gene 157 (Mug157) protein
MLNSKTRSVLHDSYANAFNYDKEGGPHQQDYRNPPMTPEVFEGKYELDSLAAVLKLSFEYYNATGDLSPFDSNWLAAFDTILATIEYQQQGTMEEGPNPEY